jgi:hypothetical protein
MQNVFVMAAATAAPKRVRPTALVVTGPILGINFLSAYKMDWRAVERNKYAPWGKGKSA